MIEKFRQQMASVLDVQKDEHSHSVKLSPIFLWFMIAGIIGGIVPFVWKTNQPMLVAISSTVLFIILTAKPVLKKSLKYDE